MRRHRNSPCLAVINVSPPQLNRQIIFELAKDDLDDALEILAIGNRPCYRVEQADSA